MNQFPPVGAQVMGSQVINTGNEMHHNYAYNQ